MGSTRKWLVLPLLVLGTGLSTSTIAREFPHNNTQFRIPQPPPTTSRLWPLPQTRYQANVNGGVATAGRGFTPPIYSDPTGFQGAAVANARLSTGKGGVTNGTAPAGFFLPRALQNVGSGAYKVRSLNGDPAKLVPDLLKNMDANYLVVRYGGDAYLVQFEDRANREKFVSRLRASLNEAGLDIRRRSQ